MIESYPILSILLISIAVRPIIVLIHELGHALAAMYFYPQNVTVYLGSHGDQERSGNIQIGRLTIWFTVNPILWQNGICFPTTYTLTPRQTAISVLAGPVMPIIVATLLATTGRALQVNEYTQFITDVFFWNAIIDLVYNLIPNMRVIATNQGVPFYNDGYTLWLLMVQKKYPDEYFTGITQYDNGQFIEAAKNFEWAARRLPNDENVQRSLIASYYQLNEFDKLKPAYDHFSKHFKMDVEDCLTAGVVNSHLNDHKQAMYFYEQALSIDPENKLALNNKAFTLQVYGKLEESITLLNKVLSKDPTFGHAINNRGYARIKLGDIDNGLKDIHLALDMDQSNSYAWRNLGIYHHSKGDSKQALQMFQRAKDLDPQTYNIDLLISSVR